MPPTRDISCLSQDRSNLAISDFSSDLEWTVGCLGCAEEVGEGGGALPGLDAVGEPRAAGGDHHS